MRKEDLMKSSKSPSYRSTSGKEVLDFVNFLRGRTPPTEKVIGKGL
jgi:hypothetical protein